MQQNYVDTPHYYVIQLDNHIHMRVNLRGLDCRGHF